MKRAQKVLSAIRQKKIFGQAKPYAIRKQKFTNKVRELIIIIKKPKPGKKKKSKSINGKFDETRPKKVRARSEKKKSLVKRNPTRCESKKSRTKFVI